MSQLQLILVNNSGNPGNLIVYQTTPNSQASDPLAWFSKYAYPQTRVSFSWDPSDWDFVWGGSGRIESGVTFEAAQVVPANLNDRNQITLSYDSANHVFFFKDQSAGPNPGSFFILEDNTLPMDAATVGIGMAGRATYVVPAMPNFNVQITLHPEYWVTFGSVLQGQFFTASNTLPPVQVVFPPNVNSMTVTLNADNTWTVAPNIMRAEAK